MRLLHRSGSRDQTLAVLVSVLLPESVMTETVDVARPDPSSRAGCAWHGCRDLSRINRLLPARQLLAYHAHRRL